MALVPPDELMKSRRKVLPTGFVSLGRESLGVNLRLLMLLVVSLFDKFVLYCFKLRLVFLFDFLKTMLRRVWALEFAEPSLLGSEESPLI